MYEDNLYLSNLYEFLDTPVEAPATARRRRGPEPGDGVRFEDVAFTLPGRDEPALDRRRRSTSGRARSSRSSARTARARRRSSSCSRGSTSRRAAGSCSTASTCASGTATALRRRIGVIFQDFVRYQLIVGENIGVGDVARSTTQPRWAEAAERGMAHAVHRRAARRLRHAARQVVPEGRELSLGQWQKIALVARVHARGRRHPRARRADRGDGRRGRGEDLRALPRAHRRQDRDPHLAPLLDRAHGRPASSCSRTAASSSTAPTRS